MFKLLEEGGTTVLSIAIDATAACTPKPTGIGRYTEGLTKALSQRQVRLEIGTRYSHFQHRKHRLQASSAREFWIQEPIWPLSRRVDVIHVTDARVPRWPLLNSRIPRVATLHDVFHILPELGHRDQFSTQDFARKKVERYRQIANECDRIISVSETTKEDFLRHIECDPGKVKVVQHGIDDIFFSENSNQEDVDILEALGVPTGGILYVGDVSARKNLKGIISGFLAADLEPNCPLILVGESTYRSEEVESLIRNAGKRRIIRLSWQKQEILAALYRQSKTLLFCTYYEGFGLPILEALACGTPVVISQSGAAPEVAGGHGYPCDAGDPESIAEALVNAIKTSAKNILSGQEYARTFTWDRCAKKTEVVYQNALGRI